MGKRKTKWNNSRLQKLFEEFNNRFWYSRLPAWNVINLECGKASNGEPILGFGNRKRKEIIINTFTHRSDTEIEATLLHEMCHIKVGGKHELRFLNEMKRIMKLGATIITNDFQRYLDLENSRQQFARLYSKGVKHGKA